MSEPNIGPQLLQQAGLSSGTLTPLDREALRQKVQRLNNHVKRLMTVALAGLALLLLCVAIVGVTRNGPDADRGMRLALSTTAEHTA